MNVILTEVVAVRIPASLKEKLAYYAEQEEMHVSGAVRTALVFFLKKEMPELFNKRPSSWSNSE
jgi:hypothetical protein